MHQKFLFPTQYFRQIINQISDMGLDANAWLTGAGMNTTVLSEEQLTLDIEAFKKLLVSALEISQEPALGLLVGERLQVNSHGMLGYAAMNSGNLRQAMELIERFIELRISLISLHHEIHGDEVRLIFNEAISLDQIQPMVLEAITLCIKNVLDFMTLNSCPIAYVAFAFPKPNYADLANDMFNCEVRYDQSWTGYCMPVNQLDIPLKQADPAMFQTAQEICKQELDLLNKKSLLSVKIRKLMLEKQNGFPSLQVTARMFNMTPRTMHRRLQAEGTSYHELLESIRQSLAMKHLKSGHMSVQEVAYTLGYSDVSNFRRAFKKWANVTPQQYMSAS